MSIYQRIIPIILSLLLFTACMGTSAQEDRALRERILDTFKDHELPSMGVVRELEEVAKGNNQTLIITEINRILNEQPTDELVAIIEKSVINYIETQELVPIESYELSVIVDDLLVIESKNQRQFNTVIVDLKLRYNNTTIYQEDIQIIGLEFADAMSAELLENVHFFYKCSDFKMKFYDQHKTPTFSFNSNFNVFNTPMYAEQSELEYKVQSFIFDFVKKMNEVYPPDPFNGPDPVVLKRFGVKQDSNDLFVEILVYNKIKDKKVQEHIDLLAKEAKSLFEQITQSKIGSDFIKETDAKAITISFYTPWNPDQLNIGYTFSL